MKVTQMPSCSWVIGWRSPSPSAGPISMGACSAPGRRARTASRPPSTCAPRMECGLWRAPPTTSASSSTVTLCGAAALGDAAAFAAGAGFAAARLRGAGLSVTVSPQQALDGAERDGKPGRSVSRLVDHLVDGLVELERPQQHVVIARVAPRGAGIAVAESVSVSLCPLGGAIFEPGRRRLLGEQVSRRVVERSQHAGDVAKGAHQGSALGERARRLTFEVDEDPAAVDAQRLAEVEVAMDPLHGHTGREVGQGV